MLLGRLALLLLGFTATSAQIVLLREFISTFHGNELVIGTFLSVWLLATAAGSGLLAKRLLGRTTPGADAVPRGGIAQERDLLGPAGDFGAVQAAASVGLLIAVAGVVAPPAWLRPGHGEVTGLLPAIACAAVYLSPACVLLGLLFPLGARMLRPLVPTSEVSTAYVLEAVGAGVGGVLTSLLLVRVASPFQTVALLAAANFLGAAALSGKAGRAAVKYLCLSLAVFSALSFVLDPVTEWASSRRWGDLPVLATKRTPYGNFAAVSLGSDFSFFQDGLLVLSTEDVQSAEEVGHVAMLQHPNPERVLLVGGGLGGALREILKQPSVRAVDYLELDPGLISLAKDVLPRHLTSPLSDHRVSLHYTDGRRFLQASDRQYDVIVTDLPPPYTAQLNRFYTREFFAVVRRNLSDGGVFSFSVPGVHEYISDDMADFLSSLQRTASAVFAQTVFLPLENSVFVCSPREDGYLTSSADSLVLRLRQRRVETLFLRDYFLESMLSPERLEYAGDRVTGRKAAGVNADLKPISFFYDLVVWSAEHERFTRTVLLWLSAHSWSLLAAVAAAGLALAGLSRSRKRRAVLPAAALAVSGFAAIVLELEIILSFQLFYGNLYDRMGLLLTAYMAGLGLGVVVERRREPALARVVFRPGLIQILTGCLALVFLFAVTAVARAQQPGLLRLLEWTFLVFALAAGGLGGALFSSASRAYFGAAADPAWRSETRAGVTYAWDLAGSWAGAALCSVVLFPVAGVVTTTVAVAFLLFVSGIGLMLTGNDAAA